MHLYLELTAYPKLIACVALGFPFLFKRSVASPRSCLQVIPNFSTICSGLYVPMATARMH